MVPETAPSVKRAAVEGYGATVVTCSASLQDREDTCAKVLRQLEDQGVLAVFVPPYNYDDTILGQGVCTGDTGGCFASRVVPTLHFVM